MHSHSLFVKAVTTLPPPPTSQVQEDTDLQVSSDSSRCD